MLRQTTEAICCQIVENFRPSYGSIDTNRGRFCRKESWKDFLVFCCAPRYVLVRSVPTDRNRPLSLRKNYIEFCKCLLYLPSRYSNSKIFQNFHVCGPFHHLYSIELRAKRKLASAKSRILPLFSK